MLGKQVKDFRHISFLWVIPELKSEQAGVRFEDEKSGSRHIASNAVPF